MPPQQKFHLERLDGSFTTSSRHDTSPSSSSVLSREIGSCSVQQIGLENFIRTIVKEIHLNLTDTVEFNLNNRGVLYSWNDVFRVESTYTRCLGISQRLYQCHSYVHEPAEGLTYFVLEEYNRRSASFLHDFKFHVLVFCWYDKVTRSVTKVSVQYDQHSFFLSCFGFDKMWHWWIARVLTPPAKLWARAFCATGFVNPITFAVQIVLLTLGIVKAIEYGGQYL
mmetsp:Transcript_949/g.1654  ORF Transcript_949/g.1654 Transcript_949/m.1654 type:complete len:224 (-) Transcript_949:1213-1884(-)